MLPVQNPAEVPLPRSLAADQHAPSDIPLDHPQAAGEDPSDSLYLCRFDRLLQEDPGSTLKGKVCVLLQHAASFWFPWVGGF